MFAQERFDFINIGKAFVGKEDIPAEAMEHDAVFAEVQPQHIVQKQNIFCVVLHKNGFFFINGHGDLGDLTVMLFQQSGPLFFCVFAGSGHFPVAHVQALRIHDTFTCKALTCRIIGGGLRPCIGKLARGVHIAVQYIGERVARLPPGSARLFLMKP